MENSDLHRSTYLGTYSFYLGRTCSILVYYFFRLCSWLTTWIWSVRVSFYFKKNFRVWSGTLYFYLPGLAVLGEF